MGISGFFGATVGALMAVGVRHGPSRQRRQGRAKIALYKDIYMGGLHTSIKRQTEQNVATLGVSLVVLGPSWRPLSPCVCNMPTLD